MKDLVKIDAKNVIVRILLTFVIIAALVFGWFSIRWQIGSMLANLTEISDPYVTKIAEASVALAPGDPSAYSLQASVSENPLETITALEMAVRVAPNDYRWRTELGRAYEQNDHLQKAEFELRKAVELAPSYSASRWHLGNFFLRRGRSDQALRELKIAAENNPVYRDQVFSLAWDYFGKDAFQLERLVGERPDLRARLAYFFAARGRADDALRNWASLSGQTKAENVVIARAIALGLYDQRYFLQSQVFLRDLGVEPDAMPEAVSNASFENNIGTDADIRFGWQISRNDPKSEAVFDSKVSLEGNRSLKITFKSFIKPTFANILQTIVVRDRQRYQLRIWIRTENLKSSGGPLLEIVNANDDKSIAKSQTFPMGTNDWREIIIDFATPDNCAGISIRVVREYCGEECPIIGTIWLDDFEVVAK